MDHATQLRPGLDTFFGVLNSGEYGKLDDVFSEGFRRVARDFGANSHDEMIAGVRQIHDAYPDFHIEINEASFSEGLGFVQWTATGTATASDWTKAGISIEGATMTHRRSSRRPASSVEGPVEEARHRGVDAAARRGLPPDGGEPALG